MINNKTAMDYNKLLLDPKFRNNLRNNSTEHVALLGYDVTNKEIKYIVKTNTKKTMFVVLLDETLLNTQDIRDLQAAGVRAGTISSTGTAGSIGCATTTVSCLSSASSAGSVGCAKT